MATTTRAISAEGRVKSMEEHDVCKGCAYVSRGEHEVPCVKCAQNASDNYKRMTQADRIRSFSDEELAEFLIHVETLGYNDSSVSGKLEMIEWLQSEVEV